MKLIPLFGLLTLMFSCQVLGERNKKDNTSPNGYQMDKPERFKVRESLQEISGLWYNGNEENFLAINDEQGKIFQVGLRTTAPYPFWKFGKSGDYEDILFTGKKWFVMKSNGNLSEVEAPFTDTTESMIYHMPKSGKKEFEALYYDSIRNSVMLICKSCETDKGQHATSVFAFSLDSMAYAPGPAYQFKYADIEGLKATGSKHFRPSAAAIHPIEKRLYIVASINKLLVVADFNGKVLETHHLPSKHFNQPEGLTFAPNGDMYISNEGDEENTADILKYKYQPHIK